MNRRLLPLSLIPLLGATSLQAADPQQGHKLVESHCQRCHGSEVYTRPDRRVTSLPGLHKQVRRCEQMLGLTWFDEDIENTAAYLNQEYYNFKE
jgi:mono/diheme cytochrome c family protein